MKSLVITLLTCLSVFSAPKLLTNQKAKAYCINNEKDELKVLIKDIFKVKRIHKIDLRMQDNLDNVRQYPEFSFTLRELYNGGLQFVQYLPTNHNGDSECSNADYYNKYKFFNLKTDQFGNTKFTFTDMVHIFGPFNSTNDQYPVKVTVSVSRDSNGKYRINTANYEMLEYKMIWRLTKNFKRSGQVGHEYYAKRYSYLHKENLHFHVGGDDYFRGFMNVDFFLQGKEVFISDYNPRSDEISISSSKGEVLIKDQKRSKISEICL